MKIKTVFLLVLFFVEAAISLIALPMEMQKSSDAPTRVRTGADARTSVGTRYAGTREDDEVATGGDAVQPARGTTLAVSEKDDDSNDMTLEKFQNALTSHPDATRFVIADDGSIQPQEETLGAYGKNRSENLTITQALRIALQSEHSLELVDEVMPHSNILLDPGVSLSAEKLREVMECLEELDIFDRPEITDRLERWSEISDTEPTKINFPSLNFSAASSIFIDPAYLREKEYAGNLLQQMVAASKTEENGMRHYAEADQIWAQAQAAWEHRTTAQWEAEIATKTLTQASKRLERAKAIFDDTKLDETILGRIASLTGRGAQISAAIPAPHAQGVSVILGSVSTITENVNYFWTHADVNIAELAQILATHTADSAKKAAEQANIAAPEIDQRAQHAEQQARLLEASARKADAERLQPPVTSFNETDWNNWATRVVQAGRGDANFIPLLADHGISDPLWTAGIVTFVRQTKVIKDLQADAAEKQKRLEPFEKTFQEASANLQQVNQKTTVAEGEVITAQKRLEAATQFYTHWKKELEESNTALNELEKSSNARKPGNAQAIKREKEKFSAAWKNLQQTLNELKTYEGSLSVAQASLAVEEAKTFPLCNAATVAEETLLRNSQRASAASQQSKLKDAVEVKKQSETLRLPQFNEGGSLTMQQLEKRNASVISYLPPIEAPEILNKVYETIGKASLKAKRNETTSPTSIMSSIVSSVTRTHEEELEHEATIMEKKATQWTSNAMEAEQAQNEVNEQAWNKATSLMQQASDFKRRAAKAARDGKTELEASWNRAASSMLYSAEVRAGIASGQPVSPIIEERAISILSVAKIIAEPLAARVTTILLPEIREPSPEDLARWEASQHAEDFIEERNDAIDTIKRRALSTASTSSASSVTTLSERTEGITKTSSSTGLTAISEETRSDSETSRPSERDDYVVPLAPMNIIRQRSNNRLRSGASVASSNTVRTNSNRSQSSIGSFVSAKTGVSRSASVAGSIPASIASTASKLELKGLKRTMSAITEAAERWAQFVRKADAARVASGGIPYPDEEALFNAWERADVVAQAAWKKRCQIKEEAIRVAALREEWEANTQRWEARATADRMTQYQEEAAADLLSLAEQQKPLDPIWKACHQTALENLDTTTFKAKEAQKKWTQFAELEESVRKTPASPEEKSLAFKKLQEKDQAIIALWERIRTDYYKEKECESRPVQKARLAQETGAYKFDLITEKNSSMAECFAEADTAYNQRLYEAADALEKTATKRYAEATMYKALQDAHDNTIGATEAWEFRVAKAVKDQKEAEARAAKIKEAKSRTVSRDGRNNSTHRIAALLTATEVGSNLTATESESKFASEQNFLINEIDNNILAERLAVVATRTLSSRSAAESDLLNLQVAARADQEEETEKTFRTVARLTSIAEADQKAFEAFQHERKEFADIEAIWKTELEAEEGNTILKRIAAAKNYLLGNVSAWHALPHQERKDYNEAVREANELLVEQTEHRLQEAKENTQKWHQQSKKVWGIFKSKKSVEEVVQQAKAELAGLKIEAEEKKVVLRWAKLCDFQHQAEQTEKDPLNVNKTKALAKIRSAIAERAWNEAKAFCDDVEISWVRKADVVQAGYRLAASCAKRVQETWNQFADERRADLIRMSHIAQLTFDDQEPRATAVAVTEGLIKAEKEKHAWIEKITRAEKNVLEILEFDVLKAKAAFEDMRAAWEELHHHKDEMRSDNVLLASLGIGAYMLESGVNALSKVSALQYIAKFKVQTSIVIDSNPYINERAQFALMSLCTTVDALAGLTVAAKNHSAMRILAVQFATFGGSVALAPYYYAYHYYKNPNSFAAVLSPLAPHTTKVAREVLRNAQETTEAAACESADTIWASDIEWCYEAIRRAHEFVTAITGAPALDEAVQAEATAGAL